MQCRLIYKGDKRWSRNVTEVWSAYIRVVNKKMTYFDFFFFDQYIFWFLGFIHYMSSFHSSISSFSVNI
ncbi:hypothetical protein N665_0336s0020 [Sinapis alba]|nr:hypothetical protein N665_0336s0020 [Sinapis alba]